jgi:hypothetical protein
MTKNILQSKTFWFNALALVVAIAGYFGFEPTQSENYTEAVVSVMAIINMLLRLVTTKAVTFK